MNWTRGKTAIVNGASLGVGRSIGSDSRRMRVAFSARKRGVCEPSVRRRQAEGRRRREDPTQSRHGCSLLRITCGIEVVVPTISAQVA